MNCLNTVLGHLREFGWNHHIERLMVLSNAATLAGIVPIELNDWMAQNYVDGAEWVMEVNVLGMGTYADGGETSTKPYIAGGNYLNKMTDYCKGCRYLPTERVGERACPLTNAYWNFLLGDSPVLTTNVRIAPQRRFAAQRPDLDDIVAQAQWARGHIVGDNL
jgi:deoxyribodipyrimidine photolyase-related protein